MMDTEGSEVHTSELEQPMKAEVWSVLDHVSSDNILVPVANLCYACLTTSLNLPLNPAQTCASCMQVGEELTLTIRDPQSVEGPAIGVSYDAFVDDVQASFRIGTSTEVP